MSGGANPAKTGCWGYRMQWMLRLAAVAGLTLLVTACASTPTTTSEPQNRAANAKMARLYFMWPGVVTSPWPIAITVDGAKVATMRGGTYFFVDRPPGARKIGMKGEVGIPWSEEIDVHAEPGPNYFQIGVSTVGQAPGTELLTRAMGGTMKGRQLGRPTMFSSAMAFFALEPDAGPAELAKLKPAGGS